MTVNVSGTSAVKWGAAAITIAVLTVVEAGGREGDAGGVAGAQEGLVSRPDLEGRRAHKGQREGVGAVGRGDAALARLAFALQFDLAGTGDVVAEGEELRG